MEQNVEKELIYVADPMCSWCWGFSPVIDRITPMLRDRAAIRVLPGGDYGFAFNPHLQNMRDLELFVKHLGFTPMEAIRSCTLYGGQVMMRPDELGLVKEGYLADLVLLDGDPLANLAILRDPKRMLAVMKDGVFAKAPSFASQRSWDRGLERAA